MEVNPPQAASYQEETWLRMLQEMQINLLSVFDRPLGNKHRLCLQVRLLRYESLLEWCLSNTNIIQTLNGMLFLTYGLIQGAQLHLLVPTRVWDDGIDEHVLGQHYWSSGSVLLRTNSCSKPLKCCRKTVCWLSAAQTVHGEERVIWFWYPLKKTPLLALQLLSRCSKQKLIKQLLVTSP